LDRLASCYRGGMPGLVEAKLAPAGKFDSGDQSPAGIVDGTG